MNIFKCNICRKKISGKYQLTRHLATHSGTKPFKCDYCSQPFARKDSLDNHIGTHHTEKTRFKCGHCGKCCHSNYQLQQHISIHTAVKPYKCPTCKKRFRYSQQLKQHKNRHAGIRPHQCHLCDKSFVCDSELKTHLNYHFGKKPYKCRHCQKKFAQHCHLQAHLRTHTGDRPFKCDLCPKSFTQSSHLQTHKSFHTGDRPHQCPICKDRFRLPHTLKSHLRRHTGERPYKCHLCSSAFTQPSPLNHHILKVHGKDSFSCSTCGKAFPSQVQVKVHQKIHFQEKRFVCVFCNKASRTNSDMEKHIRCHTQEKPIVCKTCGEWHGGNHNSKTCKGSDSNQPPPPQLSPQMPIPRFPSTATATPVLPPASQSNETAEMSDNKTEIKIFECRICHKQMKHQNHLNGHMNIHKRKKKIGRESQKRKQPLVNGLVNPPPTPRVPVSTDISPTRTSARPKFTRPPPQLLPLPTAATISSRIATAKAKIIQKLSSKKTETKPAFRLFQCKICKKVMKHQNQLNGHMNIHKYNKQPKNKKKGRGNRRPQNRLLPTDEEYLSLSMLDDDDVEIEYTTAEDEPMPIPIVIPTEEDDYDEIAMQTSRSPSPFQCRIESVRHVPVEELSTYRPFQCEFCNKFYKRKAEMEKHMEIHRNGVVKARTSDAMVPTPNIIRGVRRSVPQDIIKTEVTIKKEESNQTSHHDENYLLSPPEILEIFDDDDEEIEEDAAIAMPHLNNASKLSPPVRSTGARKTYSSPDSLPPSLGDETENFPDKDPLALDDSVILMAGVGLPSPSPAIERRKHPIVPKTDPEEIVFIDLSPSPSPSLDSSQIKKCRCDICGRTFGNNGALSTHQRTHSRLQREEKQKDIKAKLQSEKQGHGIKYKCISCNFVTFNSSDLDLHARLAHNQGNRHKCKLCGHVFLVQEMLVEHIHKYHSF